ncbi:putative BTB/POZ domain-containing protein [Raphanus sativus]|nr:putative BTB/POZ domain-containing protein [Raphanus sativus]
MSDMNKGMSDLRVNVARLEKEFDRTEKMQCLRNVMVCGVGQSLKNLIVEIESYLDKTAFCNLEKSVQVLTSCEKHELSETFKIPDSCVEAIAINACRDQFVLGLSEELKGRKCLELGIAQLSALGIDNYTRVVSVMARTGVRSESIIASMMHYSQKSLKGVVDRTVMSRRGSLKPL